MAALFFTNHKMSDVTSYFKLWRQAALDKQYARPEEGHEEGLERSPEKKRKQANASKQSNRPAGVPPIQIDTDLAN